MRQTPNTQAQYNIITTLWGLLLTKCFLLEFLVRHYEVPISSLTYVWALSILMATVATAVYADLPNKARAGLYKQAGFAMATLSGLVAALLVLAGLLAASGQGGIALALAALVLALKHSWAALRRAGAKSRWLALGWFAAAFAITFLGNPTGFLIFALSLFSLTVIPGFAAFLVRRRPPYSQQI
jgi:Mn2+/Fe2+ NRAMP family transporter